MAYGGFFSKRTTVAFLSTIYVTNINIKPIKNGKEKLLFTVKKF